MPSRPTIPLAFDYGALLQPPSLAHLFGTDNFGRDMLSRVIAASSIDLQIALSPRSCPLDPRHPRSALCVGYLRRLARHRCSAGSSTLVITFPFLVLVIAIVAVLGPGLCNMYIAVGVVGWVFYARLMRGRGAWCRRQRDYAAAARVLGYGDAAHPVPPPPAQRRSRRCSSTG